MKYVYFFNEGKADMKEVLGGKGANLSEMTNIKIPVPQGFTITTEACGYFSKHNKYPEGMESQIKKQLKKLEKLMNAKLGDDENPLLVSVRSGAAVSMPGMMDTVLNLGLNDNSVQGLINKTNNERFVYDSYRRFMQMFGDVVLEIEHHNFEKVLDAMKKKKGAAVDTDLTAEDLKELCEDYKKIYKKAGKEFPQDPMKQLYASINAVFKSWNNSRAKTYRRLNNIKGLEGTAVNVQAMVFGNMGKTSGTGVLFSRNPSNGEKKLYGEYLMNAQGEDVVAGIRTPHPIDAMKKNDKKMYKQILDISEKLEKHYKEMQDMEFTIQEEKLLFLQTRSGKRTDHAAVKIDVDMVKEK